ncbi:MAG TPA: hypothetical protein VF729_05680 [Solirubrobacterales bacterium]
MSGTRMGLVRVVSLGFCLALALLLLAAREANAGKYSVAQCGWYVGADASWADSTGGAKFRPDGYCVPPPGHDAFAGVHLKSFTRDGQGTVSGTRFARWRWQAPAGTAITRVSGTWWHALHDGMQQRIGVGTWGGGFDAFASAGSTDTTPRNFVVGVSPPQPALEDRLLCAKPESNWCSLNPGSWSALRALTITIEDNHPPSAALGGPLMSGGWRRGNEEVVFFAADTGGGVRFGETTVDGARVDLTEYPCAKALIGSEWRATLMSPCSAGGSGRATVATTAFSDGNHDLRHCVTDFAGNLSCTHARTVSIDNTPPAHPRNLALVGGDGWRRVNDFDLSWVNPAQSPGSPIAGAFWRMVGPGGFDTGVRFAAGPGIEAIADRTVPAAGVSAIEVWLRDEAGNENRSSAVAIPLRFDNLAPAVAFEPVPESAGSSLPEVVRADVSDSHSGPVRGEILYRRLNTEQWTDLPTKFVTGTSSEQAQLVARVPGDLDPGTYVFRADAADAAGNDASSRRRADGAEMALRKLPPPPLAERRPVERAEAPKAKSRLFARLSWRRRSGVRVTVPFGAGAALSGRLVTAEGAGLAGRDLRVVSRPSRGAHSRRQVEKARTGAHGGFRVPLRAGPSRRITVGYVGEAGLAAARRPALALRVRGGVIFAAAPRRLRTGESVRLWGRVRARGAPLPRRGKLVAIQYYESEARRWRPVLVVRSDHSGRFRARYRFRYVSGRASIRLRAVALAEERWPYAPGASAPVAVRVRG